MPAQYIPEENPSHEAKRERARAYLRERGIALTDIASGLKFEKGADVRKTWELARARNNERNENART